MHAVPPDGTGHVAAVRSTRALGCGVGARRHEADGRRARQADPAREPRRVEHPHCGRRSAAGAAAPVRHRAQHGDHPVGLGAGLQLHSRQRVYRQTEPHAVCERQGLGHRYRPELPVGARSEDAHGHLARGAAPRRTGARPRATGPHSGEHELAQPDARRQGQRLADDSRARLPEHAEMGCRRDGRHRRGQDR